MLLMGHTVFGVVHEFPHVCPGDECAIARWMVARQTGTEWTLPRLMTERQFVGSPLGLESAGVPNVKAPAQTIHSCTRRDDSTVTQSGKTWPELVAEKL